MINRPLSILSLSHLDHYSWSKHWSCLHMLHHFPRFAPMLITIEHTRFWFSLYVRFQINKNVLFLYAWPITDTWWYAISLSKIKYLLNILYVYKKIYTYPAQHNTNARGLALISCDTDSTWAYLMVDWSAAVPMYLCELPLYDLTCQLYTTALRVPLSL